METNVPCRVQIHDSEKVSQEPAPEGEVFGLEKLFRWGVIDKIEYYFLRAVGSGFSIKGAAELINRNESTARWCVFYARKKVRDALEDLHAGRPLRKKSPRGRKRQKVEEEVLRRAIQYILCINRGGEERDAKHGK